MSSQASALRLPGSFLFTGNMVDRSGRIEVQPESLLPVRNQVVVANAPAGSNADSESLWATDPKGLLYPTDADLKRRPTPVRYFGERRHFVLPPTDILLDAWLSGSKQWAAHLSQAYSDSRGLGTELQAQLLFKRHLRPPDKAKAGDEYAQWYQRLGDDAPFYGFVLPRIRALLLVFQDAGLVRQEIEVTPEGAPAIRARVKDVGGVVHAVLVGDDKQLPPGLYTIKAPSVGAGTWRKPRKDKAGNDEHTYTLHEQVRFPIQTLGGEFDVITCDPISVEEAMMTQFASLYSHVALAARQEALYPGAQAPGTSAVPKALGVWMGQLKWLHAKTKLATDLVNSTSRSDEAVAAIKAEQEAAAKAAKGPAKTDGKDAGKPKSKPIFSQREKIIGGLIWSYLDETEDKGLQQAKKTIDLVLRHKGVPEKWSNLRNELAAERKIEGLRKLLWKDLDTWNRYRWWKYFKGLALKGDGPDAQVLKFAESSAVARAGILAVGIPEKSTKLHELAGKSAATQLGRALTLVDWTTKAIDTYSAIAQYLEEESKLEALESDFTSLLGQLDGALQRRACREAIGNLERLRTATVAGALKVGEEQRRAMMAALDLTLAALTAVGVGGAGLAVVVMAKGLVTDLATWFERTLIGHYFSDFYVHRVQMLADQARASHANQDALRQALGKALGPAGGVDDMHVQFRLRAEALNGLAGLLIRASGSAKDEQEYFDNLAKYRVEEYIKLFLLQDGWQLPLRPLVPLGMDAVWLHVAGPHSPLSTLEAVAEQLGLTRPLKAAAFVLPGAMATMVAANEIFAGNAKASFQGPFPVHQLASDFKAFAEAFRPAWPELDEAAVELTTVSWRPRGHEGEGGWQPIDPRHATSAGDLEIRSPLDQIRVLVVLKDEVTHAPVASTGKDAPVKAYPVSLQLWRYDGNNLAGPVYRGIARPLRQEDLLPEEHGAVGKVGCVFYPFFQFGPQVVPGTKPIAGSLLQGEDVGTYRFLGLLSDMRYGFELKLGRSEAGIPVKLSARSELDEYRVGIRNQPDENRLVSASFLKSRTTTHPLPPLFRLNAGAGPGYARVGGGEYRLASPEHDHTLRFDRFTWNEPVEFVVVMWATVVNTHLYEQQGYDWTRVPITVDLEDVMAFPISNNAGPTYSSELEFVGHLHPASHHLALHHRRPERAVSEWAARVASNPAEVAALAQAIHDPGLFSGGMAPRYHVFAAHFRMEYFTPSEAHASQSRPVDSLRPFGHVIPPIGSFRHYRYRLCNVRLAEGADWAVRDLKAEFQFPVPASYLAGVPWAGVSPQRIQRWIEDESTRRNPELELIHK